ncbi:phosphatase PAP2 family protein [Aquihabitans sp. McL0605]|uniref:phosphatase PAP2 family protein n=1 Tax=Aquihabitans sp. McL0605 TaxID=3415671 RepID=UPI003CF2D9B9
MTAATSTDTDTDPAPVEHTPQSEGLKWWHEVLLAGAFYLVYSQVRNFFGAGPESRLIAFGHAKDVIKVEDTLHLWIEPHLQHWYLSLPSNGYIRFWNIYYGTAHFIVTIAVLVIAFRKAPARYRFIRTTLAGTTGLALIGFASFTLMPPRLLGDTSIYGACLNKAVDCHGYGIVDTIDHWGGLWTFGSGGMAAISNQYAAMPSLHIGWSTWCALSMCIVIGRGWKRYLWFLYPASTFFCILVTGNHYWLDAFFGLVALSGGLLIAVLGDRIRAATLARRAAAADTTAASAA